MKNLAHKRFYVFLLIMFLIVCVIGANFKSVFDGYSMKDAVCAEKFYADIDGNGFQDLVINACYYPNNSGIVINQGTVQQPPK